MFGLYVWIIGGADLGGSPGIQGLFRLPWLGYGLLLGCCRFTHLSCRSIDGSRPVSFCDFGDGDLGSSCEGRQGKAGAEWTDKAWPRLAAARGRSPSSAFIPVFNTCTKPACHYDLGLYYLQEIRWMETFPIVPGLGNLIFNLGFNQSAFLVTSLLDSLLPDRIGLWLVGGLLPWLGLTLSAYALIRLFAARKADALFARSRLRDLASRMDLHAPGEQHLQRLSRRYILMPDDPSLSDLSRRS